MIDQCVHLRAKDYTVCDAGGTISVHVDVQVLQYMCAICIHPHCMFKCASLVSCGRPIVAMATLGKAYLQGETWEKRGCSLYGDL